METLEKHKLITGFVSIEWVHINSFVRGFDNRCFLDGFYLISRIKNILVDQFVPT